MVMSGPARMALHAVARVMKNTVPNDLLEHCATLQEKNPDFPWTHVKNYMKEARNIINVFLITYPNSANISLPYKRTYCSKGGAIFE